MFLNTIKPAKGSKKKSKRVGRGMGSGCGKTCGSGHKGQKSRSGGYHKRGFEGGQMPFQMRVPKFGFTSRKSLYRQEVRLDELNIINETVINLSILKKNNIINKNVINAKIIKSGNLKKSVKIIGLLVTKGARNIIELAGGVIE